MITGVTAPAHVKPTAVLSSTRRPASTCPRAAVRPSRCKLAAKNEFCERRLAGSRGVMLRKTAPVTEAEAKPLGKLSTVAKAYKEGDLERSAEDVSKQAHSLAPVLFCVFVASLGAYAFGFHLGVVNGPLDAIAVDLGFAGNAALQGAVVSSTLAGAAVGSLGGSGLADRLGRRTSFFLDAVPLLLGAILCATAGSFNTMIAGRFLAGIGIGLSSALVPLYISEVAPTNVRGTLGSLNQLMICVGILGALVANVVIPAYNWRQMFYLSAVPAVLLAAGMLFCAESPRWLFGQRRNAEASAEAQKLWGASGPDQLGDEKSGRLSRAFESDTAA